MQFNSYTFSFLFLPMTVTVFWLLLRHLGRGHAIGWLLVTSVIFYACTSLKGFAIVAPSILIDYGIVRCMLRQGCAAHARRALLLLGICLNVLFLGYFKYRNFFLDIANSELGAHFIRGPLFLPVGISFLVFQKIAFLADVDSGELKVMRLRDYCLPPSFQEPSRVQLSTTRKSSLNSSGFQQAARKAPGE
jgi:alginate O-acetyltransferase complex protein AlgI